MVSVEAKLVMFEAKPVMSGAELVMSEVKPGFGLRGTGYVRSETGFRFK